MPEVYRQHLEKLFVDRHHRDLPRNLYLPIYHFNVFTRFDLLGLVGKLLVVLEAFLSVRDIILKSLLRIVLRQRRHLVAVQNI